MVLRISSKLCLYNVSRCSCWGMSFWWMTTGRLNATVYIQGELVIPTLYYPPLLPRPWHSPLWGCVGGSVLWELLPRPLVTGWFTAVWAIHVCTWRHPGRCRLCCSLVSTKPTLRLELKYILWFVVPQNDVLKFLGFPLVVQLVFGEFHGKQVPIDTGNVAIYVWPFQAMILKVKINLVCCTHSGGEIPSTAQSSMATLHPIAQDHQT